MARRAGILHDRGHSVAATGMALLLALVAIGVAAWGRNSIWLIILAIILIDIAVQTLNVLHQTRIISINPAMRSRLSTIFVVSNFIGAAIGSALAGILWHAGGWSAVMIGAAGFLALALGIWFMNRDSLKLT